MHAKNPTNISCWDRSKEEWAKIPTRRCAWLISSYQKHVVEVIPAKRGHTSYTKQWFTYLCLTQICKNKIILPPKLNEYIFVSFVQLGSLDLVLGLVWKSDLVAGHTRQKYLSTKVFHITDYHVPMHCFIFSYSHCFLFISSQHNEFYLKLAWIRSVFLFITGLL